MDCVHQAGKTGNTAITEDLLTTSFLLGEHAPTGTTGSHEGELINVSEHTPLVATELVASLENLFTNETAKTCRVVGLTSCFHSAGAKCLGAQLATWLCLPLLHKGTVGRNKAGKGKALFLPAYAHPDLIPHNLE